MEKKESGFQCLKKGLFCNLDAVVGRICFMLNAPEKVRNLAFACPFQKCSVISLKEGIFQYTGAGICCTCLSVQVKTRGGLGHPAHLLAEKGQLCGYPTSRSAGTLIMKSRGF